MKAAFAYFVPAFGGHDLLERAGIADRFAGVPFVSALAADGRGPDGLAGTAFHAGPRLPANLTWAPAPEPAADALPFYVGFDPGLRPGPADLAREATVLGQWVRLCDGREWLVPLVHGADTRPAAQRCGLPTEPALIGGRMRLIVAPRYAALQAACEALPDVMRDWPARADACFALCVDLLGVAYRIGAAEVLALGLLDADTMAAVASAAVDLLERVKAADAADAAPAACG